MRDFYRLQTLRCIMNPKDIHVNKKAQKKARGLTLTIDKAFETTMSRCSDYHDNTWMVGNLRKAFQIIHEGHKEDGCVQGPFRTSIRSVECWRGEALVAGEIGVSCGSSYTSLTAFTGESGCGTIQMLALAKVLERSNFDLWDLGMSLKYKLDMGAREVTRGEFLQRYR
eukprot:GHVO01057703.1.p1 GENE.GHVO01057703.1~~GHVO01057703.1.p1  ORF type:complete len:169 (-),score=30.42 GHVO01057703.1:11-517(-)